MCPRKTSNAKQLPEKEIPKKPIKQEIKQDEFMTKLEAYINSIVGKLVVKW